MCRPEFDESIVLTENAMLKVRPELYYEWNFKKNNELDLNVYTIKRSSDIKVWWVCPSCNSDYDMPVKSRTHKRKQGCPFCRGLRVNHTNSLASLRPDVAKLWHPTLNNEVSPYSVTCGSDKKVWWLCSVCNSSYDMTVKARAKINLNNERCCPYGHGKRVNKTNSLKVLNPKLAMQWHSTKNNDLTPHDVTCSSSRKVWWLGECGHEWDAIVLSRNNGHGCPICNNKKILIGYNDMWTTNPELASLLLDPEDGYKYTENSGKKLNWKCMSCSTVLNNKKIQDVKNRNVRYCTGCSDGKKYPEKFMYYLLKELEVSFEWEKTFNWSNKKRYDFFIRDSDLIIEMHGGQHYQEKQSKQRKGLQAEQANDKVKKDMAIENGILSYVVINSSKSELDFMKQNIVDGLGSIFDLSNVGWEKVERSTYSSLLVKACEMWNSGYKTIEIMRELDMGRTAIVNYLNKGTKTGLCNFTGGKKAIVQLDLSENFIRDWKSITSAENCLNIFSIGACCRGQNKRAGQYKWMYREDYEELLNSKL